MNQPKNHVCLFESENCGVNGWLCDRCRNHKEDIRFRLLMQVHLASIMVNLHNVGGEEILTRLKSIDEQLNRAL